MTINPLRRDELDSRSVRFTSHIDIESAIFLAPRELWFSFEPEQEKYISPSLDSFVLPLIPLAMMLGEDIHVRGHLSPHLAYGMREYQKILTFWYPDKFKLINITCEGYHKSSYSERRGTMTAFSGGIDSSYTLWSHLKEREERPEFRVTHALFVHGFDIPLHDTRTFGVVSDAYRALTSELGITLCTATTNVKDFADEHGLEWDLTHSASVLATALFFEPTVARCYFPENDTLDNGRPTLGAHPTLVPLFSTESFRAISHGATVSKFDKIRALVSWPQSYGTLRVCWKNPNGIMNCGNCWKCIYTMSLLDMAGGLARYHTFSTPLTRKKIRSVITFYPGIYHYYRWLKRDALSVGRVDIVFDYTIAVIRSTLKDWKKKVLR